jgi:hypothetical protein
MADEIIPEIKTPSLPVATPAVTAPPSVGTPAVVPTAAAPRKVPFQAQKKGSQIIQIPQVAFKARVDREAIAIIKRKFGMTLEEAEKIIAGGSGGQTSGNPQQVADLAAKKYAAEIDRLKKQNDISKKQALEWERKHKKDTTRLRDRQVETELRLLAVRANVVDPEYAVHLFARAAAKGDVVDPAVFFKGLQATHAFLFSAPTAPAVVDVRAVTAPLESQQPGEDRPSPTQAGSLGATVNVEDMDPQQFSKHLRSYGFVPGQ